MQILIVDDDSTIRRTLRVTFEAAGHAVVEAATPDAAIAAAGAAEIDLALVDLRLGMQSGLDLLPRLLDVRPRLAIIIITAYAAIDTAVEAIRRGAVDYLAKPFTPAMVRVVVDRVGQVRGLRDRVARLEDTIRAEVPEITFEGDDPALARVLDVARRVAPTDATVLIRGENGTGKGVVARLIHEASRRADRPFVTVSCPSLGADLLESTLFGHVRGAFTGAVRDGVGLAAAAEGGTLFLDEIGELPTTLQPKLLRFLQDRTFERVGEPQLRSANVRFLAATNRDLEAAVAAGTFREDLLYRLNVIEVRVPPLRERADLPRLADRLLASLARQMGRKLTGFTAEARAALGRHGWPGNVRELRNVVERAVILADGPEIGVTDLADLHLRPNRVIPTAPPPSETMTLRELELEHIRRVLATTPSLDAAANILGIDSSTLFRKRKLLGL